MPIDWDSVRDFLIALVIIGAVSLGCSLLSAGSAHAQIAVSDAATEASTAQTASELSQTNLTLKQDVQENAQTSRSVTTPGGAGFWQSNAGYLASLESNFNGGINSPQRFAGNFPGWVALPPNATQVSKQVAANSLSTYAGALSAAQQQAAGFSNEDTQLRAIESGNQKAAGVLQAIQVNTEAQLAVAQQIQFLRQLVIAQITLEATKAGEELNERAQAQATVARSVSLGVTP